jgi:hypothetical protein
VCAVRRKTSSNKIAPLQMPELSSSFLSKKTKKKKSCSLLSKKTLLLLLLFLEIRHFSP